MSTEADNRFDAIFAGGGVIGLASAWRAAQRGARVCVLERDRPGGAASWAAAGMIAPVGEAEWGEEALLKLALESARAWPAFSEELSSDSGMPSTYRRSGALHVALDRDEADALRRYHDLHESLGLESEWLRGRDCRRLEPGLSVACVGGALAAEEGCLDPRALTAALAEAAGRAGVQIRAGTPVTDGIFENGALRGVVTADGRSHRGRCVVLSAGAWSGAATWLPAEARPPVRPVKGEILTLRGAPEQPVCERIIVGERVYLVPRDDGRLAVGATVEERGFDVTVTAGGIHELLREAYRTLPEIAELELLEVGASLRPGSPDNAPLIGTGSLDGLIYATGHYRNGILLTPVTADAVAALIANEEPAVDLAPFSPERFGARARGSTVEVA